MIRIVLYPVGEWEISVLYDNEHISGSPYTVSVYDPSLVKVFGLEGGSMDSAISFNGKISIKQEKTLRRIDLVKLGALYRLSTFLVF